MLCFPFPLTATRAPPLPAFSPFFLLLSSLPLSFSLLSFAGRNAHGKGCCTEPCALVRGSGDRRSLSAPVPSRGLCTLCHTLLVQYNVRAMSRECYQCDIVQQTLAHSAAFGLSLPAKAREPLKAPKGQASSPLPSQPRVSAFYGYSANCDRRDSMSPWRDRD